MSFPCLKFTQHLINIDEMKYLKIKWYDSDFQIISRQIIKDVKNYKYSIIYDIKTSKDESLRQEIFLNN
jgi:hypothetical protein